jgi:hypothetical protein
VVDKNKELQEQLKRVKLENEALANRKVELTQELKRAKEDLGTLIERGELQKSQFAKDLAQVRD